MKRRTKRDIGIFLSVLMVIGGIAIFNSEMQRGDLIKKMEAWRTRLEKEKTEEGVQLLSWSLMRKTKGTLRGGGEMLEDLVAKDGEHVNLMGFMVPEEQFRDVTEFLMLPLPIECYFCAMPPSRDVMFVKLKEGETADIFREPVLINGILNVHAGPDVKFFYSITEASLGAGDPEAGLSRRKMELQHMLPQHEKDPELLLDAVVDEDASTD